MSTATPIIDEAAVVSPGIDPRFIGQRLPVKLDTTSRDLLEQIYPPTSVQYNLGTKGNLYWNINVQGESSRMLDLAASYIALDVMVGYCNPGEETDPTQLLPLVAGMSTPSLMTCLISNMTMSTGQGGSPVCDYNGNQIDGILHTRAWMTYSEKKLLAAPFALPAFVNGTPQLFSERLDTSYRLSDVSQARGIQHWGGTPTNYTTVVRNKHRIRLPLGLLFPQLQTPNWSSNIRQLVMQIFTRENNHSEFQFGTKAALVTAGPYQICINVTKAELHTVSVNLTSDLQAKNLSLLNDNKLEVLSNLNLFVSNPKYTAGQLQISVQSNVLGAVVGFRCIDLANQSNPMTFTTLDPSAVALDQISAYYVNSEQYLPLNCCEQIMTAYTDAGPPIVNHWGTCTNMGTQLTSFAVSIGGIQYPQQQEPFTIILAKGEVSTGIGVDPLLANHMWSDTPGQLLQNYNYYEIMTQIQNETDWSPCLTPQRMEKGGYCLFFIPLKDAMTLSDTKSAQTVLLNTSYSGNGSAASSLIEGANVTFYTAYLSMSTVARDGTSSIKRALNT
jgi:hypothetical protein